jgi:spore germination cell wall hydrolase CwlJ-like protein
MPDRTTAGNSSMAWFDTRRAGWSLMGAVALLLAASAAPVPANAQSYTQVTTDTPDQQALLGTTDAYAPLANPGFAAADELPIAPVLDDRGRALDCMSVAIAYEAAGQPVEGQQAVGQVILNRMRDPRFPKTVCGVVFQGSDRLSGCQFTFTCDGSYRRRLADTTLFTARSIAETVMAGIAPDRVSGATHYHANYVLPYWAASGQRVTRIGAHIFYRMPGDVLRAAVAANLTLTEPDVPALHRLAGHRYLKPGTALAQATPVAPAIFSPWGLPVAGASRR